MPRKPDALKWNFYSKEGYVTALGILRQELVREISTGRSARSLAAIAGIHPTVFNQVLRGSGEPQQLSIHYLLKFSRLISDKPNYLLEIATGLRFSRDLLPEPFPVGGVRTAFIDIYQEIIRQGTPVVEISRQLSLSRSIFRTIQNLGVISQVCDNYQPIGLATPELLLALGEYKHPDNKYIYLSTATQSSIRKIV